MKYLVQWFCWFALFVVVLGVYGFENVFVAVAGDPTGIVLGMVGFTVAILIFSFINIIHISRQMYVVDIVEKAFQAGEPFPEEALSAKIGHHLRNLKMILDQVENPKSERVDQGRLIDVLGGELESRDRFVDLASGLLTSLGFVGTLVGMVAVVGGLEDMMTTITDGENGIAGMSTTIGGMRTVFFTTIVGALGGGVLLQLLHHIYMQGSDTLLRRIDELTEVRVIPYLRKVER